MRTTAASVARGSAEQALLIIGLALLLTVSGCATHVTPLAPPPAPITYAPHKPPPKPPVHVVKASWYGTKFAGRPTTSGERFDPNRLTAASKTLPLGSVIKVENPTNGRSVTVRITIAVRLCVAAVSTFRAERRKKSASPTKALRASSLLRWNLRPMQFPALVKRSA